MQTMSIEAAKNVLLDIISGCRELNQILLNDTVSFTKDDLDTIESNNRKKNIVLNEINLLSQSLKNNQLNSDNELRDLISQMTHEIQDCFKSMVINNNIINNNMKQLKDIWDKLLENNTEHAHLYDKNGVTSK
jgi:hypothetical protein